MSTSQWLYLKIGTPGVLAAESLLRHVIVPFMGERGYLGSTDQSTWFFIRYLDATGLHLRIRIWGQLQTLQEMDVTLRSALGHWHAQGKDQITYVRRAVYVPEWVKWGGPDGVRWAEKVFAASSRFALAVPSTYWERRYGLALLLMRRGVDMLPPEQRVSFTYNYAWFWSGGDDPIISSMREVVRHGARRAADHLVGQMALWESSSGEWRSLMECYVQALEDDLSRTDHPGRRLFNHLHLTSNRLGVSPRDEALLAEALRL
ncbi:thiopeptide-type bacteriocin biosynthesis domain protein [Propionibacterium acidifaciens F0233]|uniref:Thiopeptide-type bacteriocin biosynthesis domain protein n=1 Tax=Propionibacterium acidifaciens F0233 TaxID=553198 RepID=U2QER1_9ACTN|nr:thiopeptide-type bacteriocin biosynthesis protein [Propionibacterium acidifaciens]AYW78359.1 hypothetical protein EGX94_10060 [Propionibacterium acidifaciens]ERK54911.1 thiopeptide-type bacteriocin biosynthesis domain protein [Propionibacterium acidifaciens F0233]